MSRKEKFSFLDGLEKPILKVSGSSFGLTPKYLLYDAATGEEKYHIKQRVSLVYENFEIYEDNRLLTTVQPQFSTFGINVDVRSQMASYSIITAVMSCDYTINRNGEYFGIVHKKKAFLGTCCEIDIIDDRDFAFVCALILSACALMNNGRR